MRIVVLVDRETVVAEDPEFTGSAEAVRSSMEFHVVGALRELSYEVRTVPFGPDIVATAEALRKAEGHLVFNLTEHFGGDRRKDANVAALLELLDLPYTGSGPSGLMLCRDKATCKRILGHHRLRLPRFAFLPAGQTKLPTRLPYPVIVKPVFEDGSDGISLASLVRSDAELQDRARMIHERMKQPAICEEYVEGRELYIGIIGNERLRALPARELRFGRTGEGGPNIATARVKWDEEYRKKWDIAYGPADLPAEQERKVARISKRIFHLLQIRDYARVDLRLTAGGEVAFLEVNPNPNLSPDEDVAEAAAKVGIDYKALIDRIVNLALKRYA